LVTELVYMTAFASSKLAKLCNNLIFANHLIIRETANVWILISGVALIRCVTQ